VPLQLPARVTGAEFVAACPAGLCGCGLVREACGGGAALAAGLLPGAVPQHWANAEPAAATAAVDGTDPELCLDGAPAEGALTVTAGGGFPPAADTCLQGGDPDICARAF